MTIAGKAIATLLLALAGSEAFAQDVADYVAARQDFERLVSGATTSKQMPRVSDPNVAALFSTLSDHRRFLDSQPYDVDDIGILLDVCNGATKAMMSYALFDLPAQVGTEKDPS